MKSRETRTLIATSLLVLGQAGWLLAFRDCSKRDASPADPPLDGDFLAPDAPSAFNLAGRQTPLSFAPKPRAASICWRSETIPDGGAVIARTANLYISMVSIRR